MNENPHQAQGATLLLHSQPSTCSAASSNGAGDGDDDAPEQQLKRPRRALITRSACRRCRQRKSKCDGRRPTCGRCAKLGDVCMFDVAQEGLTRMQHLQQQLRSKTQDCDLLQGLVMAMKQKTEQEATALLAKLRSNVSNDEMLEFARTTRDVPFNVRYGSTLADSAPQVNGLPIPWDCAQYRYPTQPIHPSAFSFGNFLEKDVWTAPRSLIQGRPILQSQHTFCPSQRLSQYPEGKRPDICSIVDQVREEGSQQGDIDWQT